MSNFVLAKVSGEKDYKVLISNLILYNEVESLIINSTEINLSNTIDDSVLEENSWHFISNFSNTAYALPILTNIGDVVDYPQYTFSDSGSIAYLIACQEDFLCFQGISKSKIMKKKFFSLGDSVKLEEDTDVLFVKDVPDAIYSLKDNRLYFTTLRSISSLFKNISDLYREATNEEVEAFLCNDFIQLENDYCRASVGIPNRRRIALISNILNGMTDECKTSVFTYINGYVPSLKYNNGVFSISSEDDLKNLLYGIDERFYTTSISQEKRVANSIKKLTLSEKKT